MQLLKQDAALASGASHDPADLVPLEPAGDASVGEIVPHEPAVFFSVPPWTLAVSVRSHSPRLGLVQSLDMRAVCLMSLCIKML